MGVTTGIGIGTISGAGPEEPLQSTPRMKPPGVFFSRVFFSFHFFVEREREREREKKKRKRGETGEKEKESKRKR